MLLDGGNVPESYHDDGDAEEGEGYAVERGCLVLFQIAWVAVFEHGGGCSRRRDVVVYFQPWVLKMFEAIFRNQWILCVNKVALRCRIARSTGHSPYKDTQ